MYVDTVYNKVYVKIEQLNKSIGYNFINIGPFSVIFWLVEIKLIKGFL